MVFIISLYVMLFTYIIECAETRSNNHTQQLVTALIINSQSPKVHTFEVTEKHHQFCLTQTGEFKLGITTIALCSYLITNATTLVTLDIRNTFSRTDYTINIPSKGISLNTTITNNVNGFYGIQGIVITKDIPHGDYTYVLKKQVPVVTEIPDVDLYKMVQLDTNSLSSQRTTINLTQFDTQDADRVEVGIYRQEKMVGKSEIKKDRMNRYLMLANNGHLEENLSLLINYSDNLSSCIIQ